MRLFLILHSVKSHEKMTIKLNHLHNFFFDFINETIITLKSFCRRKSFLANHEMISIQFGIKEKHLSHVNSNCCQSISTNNIYGTVCIHHRLRSNKIKIKHVSNPIIDPHFETRSLFIKGEVWIYPQVCFVLRILHILITSSVNLTKTSRNISL